MPLWIWRSFEVASMTLITIYVFGFVALLVLQAAVAPNLTIPLMLLRSAVWPIFIATGWPQGVPLTMD